MSKRVKVIQNFSFIFLLLFYFIAGNYVNFIDNNGSSKSHYIFIFVFAFIDVVMCILSYFVYKKYNTRKLLIKMTITNGLLASPSVIQILEEIFCLITGLDNYTIISGFIYEPLYTVNSNEIVLVIFIIIFISCLVMLYLSNKKLKQSNTDKHETNVFVDKNESD